jgi:hypothetical protein
MNSVDKFVFQSMLSYPSLYSTRAAVLAHALFVIGNAIPWHNGELVSNRRDITVKTGLAKIDDEYKKDRTVISSALSNEIYDEEMINKVNSRAIARLDEDREVVLNAEKLAVIKCPVGAFRIGVYAREFCTYSNIFNIPASVTPEWLEACYEIAEWAKAENPHYDELIAYLDTVKKYVDQQV